MRFLIACAAALACASLPAGAQEKDEFSVGTGLHYSTGDYGTGTDTEVVSIPFMGRWDRGLLTVRVTVPWLEVSGGAAVVPGVGAVANNPRARGRGAGAAGEASASGLGDTVVAASWGLVRDARAGQGLDITGKVKLATADEDEGLGTGEHDFGVFADAYKAFGATTVFLGAGHTWLGSSPGLDLNDVWSVNVGASHRLDERDSAGLSFDWRERVSSGSQPLRELTAFFIRKLDRRWSAQAYVLKGFSDGSPDWGAGLLGFYAF